MGLPPKPGGQPPLPAGPAPNYGGGQDPQAAHAAAWAAYYQAQGYNTAGYNAGAAQPSAGAAGTPPNPYANYGYGAGASHAQNPGYNAAAGYQQQYSGQQQGQSYRPPPPQQQQQGYNNYNQANQQGYNNYQGGPGGQGYNNYNGQGAGYTPQPNQPYFPQQAQSGSYMSGGGGSGGGGDRGGGGGGGGGRQNRPYQPQSRNVSGASNPPRPPSGGFPPAKRPRFDGPGGGGGGQNGSPQGASGGSLPPRPPGARPPQNYSGMARPMSNARGGGPIPRIGFGGPGGRGGGGGGGGGGMRGGGMRGGGPMRGGMQRPGQRRDNFRQPGQHTQGQGKRVDQSPRMDRKRKEKTEAKTTMTDFRIVGIEVKSLDWSWGLIGEHVFEEEKEEKDAEAKEESKDEARVKEEKKDEEKPAEDPASEAKEEKDEAKDEAKPEVKEEAKPEPDAGTDEAVEPTVGAKRKAKPSSIDGEESPKKRSSSFVSHKESGAQGVLSSPESNQNRFRIYFESPPELDRVPKSARRNPNKRWRRESSSVAPSRLGEVEEHDEEAAESQEQGHEQAEAAEAQPEGGEAPKATDTPAEGDSKDAEAKPEASEAADAAKAADEAQPEPSTEAKEPEEKKEEAVEEAGDVSMASASGDAAEDSAAAIEAAMAESAQNAASAYGNRTGKSRSRRWSTSSLESHQSDAHALAEDASVPQPSVNRVSVLYEESSRRLVFDASVVSKIRIFRAEGRIEVDVLPQPQAQAQSEVKAEAKPDVKAEGEEKPADAETDEKKENGGDDAADKTEAKPEEDKSDDLPKGVLVETYDPAEQRFISVTRDRLASLSDDGSLPPLHRVSPGQGVTLTVYLNKKKPLSEPKWCRTNQADEWLWEQFGRRSESGWRGKLEIMDPDAPPTLATILDTWKTSSSSGTASDRGAFTASLLASPNDLLEILLRLTRGERNPTASIGTGPTSANGPLATAIRADSPYASHQTHVSLAILAMYRLTTEYAAQAGQSDVLNEKIADIIKSLPTHMIHKSLDGLYKEWQKAGNNGNAGASEAPAS